MPDLFAGHRVLIEQAQVVQATGRVVEVTGLTVVAEGLALPVGSLCTIEPGRSGCKAIVAQVVGVQQDHVVLKTCQFLGVFVHRGDPRPGVAPPEHGRTLGVVSYNRRKNGHPATRSLARLAAPALPPADPGSRCLPP